MSPRFFGAALVAAGLVGGSEVASAQAEFPVSTGSAPWGIVSGPDGNMWFAESSGNAIGRFTPAGTLAEFPVPTASSQPLGVAAGPDGNVWFTEFVGDRIGRITPAGVVTEFSLSTGSEPVSITSGPDGNLWFTESGRNQIGRITPAGTITEFAVPTTGSIVTGITLGSDGSLWFTEYQGNKIGRVTTSGVFTEFPLPAGSLDPPRKPNHIASGPDGNLWFTEDRSGPTKIGRITTAGGLTEFDFPTSATGRPIGICPGDDGNIWFAEWVGNKLARITPAGSVTEYDLPATDGPYLVAAGPYGTIWYTRVGADRVGRFALSLPTSLFTLTPCRLVDTRDPAGPFGGPSLQPAQQRTFQARGCGIPSTAKSISANLTIVNPSQPGYLLVLPTDQVLPPVSTLNFFVGQVRANNSLIWLSPDGTGRLTVLNHSNGTVDLVLDVNGYFQ